MKIYSEDDMNAAIARVETAKQNHPFGWKCLEEFGLKPADDFVSYIWLNSNAHIQRLGREEDRRLVYSAGWMNGIMVGVALGEEN